MDFTEGLSSPKKKLFKRGNTDEDNLNLDSIFKDNSPTTSPGYRNPQDRAKRQSIKQAT